MKVQTPAEILIVDDIPDNIDALSDLLEMRGYQVQSALSGHEALLKAQNTHFDLILLDISMPEMDGFATCLHLKANEKTKDIPVIFLSAIDRTQDKVKAFEVGGADYLTKPFQFQEVLVRIQHQLALVAATNKIQQMHDYAEQLVQERTAQLQTAIAEQQQTHQQLLHLISHDSVTNLPNRSLFMNHLEKAVEEFAQNPTNPFALLFLNCDRFKAINRSVGHTIGNHLLRDIAERLQTCLSEEDLLARVGGDEFMILREGFVTPATMTQFAQHIQSVLHKPFLIDNQMLSIRVSIGIVLGTTHHQSLEHLLQHADSAMLDAKLFGGGCYQLFCSSMQEQSFECGAVHGANHFREKAVA